MENNKLRLQVHPRGYVESLVMKDDPYQMNWVIDNQYLKQKDFDESDKLYGEFTITINGQKIDSHDLEPTIISDSSRAVVTYKLQQKVQVIFIYDLADDNQLDWEINLKNLTTDELTINNFGVWLSLAYVMFRDKNVAKNIHESAAVYPSISRDFTKINAVRRDNQSGNLGIYQTAGKTLSVGTYAAYNNLFFENVSPSLDGMLFHQLILAGGYDEDFENNDWIYDKNPIIIKANETKIWHYVMQPNDSKQDFYQKAREVGQPTISYQPLNVVNQPSYLTIAGNGHELVGVTAIAGENGQQTTELKFQQSSNHYQVVFKPTILGEHQITFDFADGTQDAVVLNVMTPLNEVIDRRVQYISEELYQGADGEVPYAFTPISNQGESLGKLSLVLKKNLMGALDQQQVRQVEASAVNYVRPKWFTDGNFRQPSNLYGDFYRCMDFEYIAHLFLLLSEFDDETLLLNSSEEYLQWAADVFMLRVNPDLHETARGKEEAQMLGVYFLYIQDLLKKLKAHGLTDYYDKINNLWQQVTKKLDDDRLGYQAAITEHYFDNAGFGPTAGALSEAGFVNGAETYGQLLLANIGYSNDFRAQNPDRWWEALAYMIHSLWGGVTAAATFKVYEALKDTVYLDASYRATAAIMYCYDTNSVTTTKLSAGMAASTYAVAGPHLNRPDLSRNRFGQSTFYSDGGIFAKLFNSANETPDWDMGEELVAYLDGIGQRTYLIHQNDSWSVINGTYEEVGDQINIISFAPYQKEFWLIDETGTRQLSEVTSADNYLFDINK
ncbi:hypothetical protein NBT14_07580 [Weissella paramesenteroides]|jgi:hypothetical protein|uniref:Uncharacterized protein n=1 Tax=Weissella paramesenteroides TaxID=1249 RepID=A0ABD4XGU5_WEIPA|nr:hypothetical protein [Weissella paramesenteroides]MDF8368699.1 hypothetical protein [Weissella paramesenteroides]MDF8370529.1 hypothetical protein [Weissella paramesenteroides]MDF8372903.1 hypothetical protein [Weissella paramesenteroides]WIG66886.1 hypothetical protein G9U56_08100 [Weissella paramesenteroides]